MNVRMVLLTVALVAVGIGLAILVQPPLAAIVSVHTVLLGIIGLGLLFLGGARIHRATKTLRESEETGLPERVVQVPAPGDEIDRQLASFEFRPKKEYEVTLHSLEDRLEQAIIEVIMRDRSCSEAEAYEVLHSGEWSEDPVAAGYYAREFDVLHPEGWRERLTHQINPDLVRRRRLERTMEALALHAGIEPTEAPE